MSRGYGIYDRYRQRVHTTGQKLILLLPSKYVIYFSSVFLIVFIAFRDWFFKASILTQGDWFYYTKATLKTFRLMYFHVWLSDNNFGRVLIDVGQAPTYALYGALARWLGLGYPYGERIVHMIPTVVIAPISSYVFLRLFSNRLLAIATGTVIYCCNTYFLQLLTGDITIAAAYALAPLVVYVYVRHFRQPSVYHGVVAAIVTVIMSSYEPRITYVALIAVLLYGAYRMLLPDDRAPLFSSVSNTLLTLLPFGLFLLMSLYWLIGVYASGAGGPQSILSRGLFGGQFFLLQNALTLSQPYWTGSTPVPFVYHVISAAQWLIPLGAVFSLYLNRTNKFVFYCAALVVIGVLLGKQQTEPFLGLYPWLFAHAPGFNAFREASKFYLLIALGAAGLFTMLIDRLLSDTGYQPYKISFALLFILILAWNLKPFITGSIGTTTVARTPPLAYTDWNHFIESQPGFARVLWLPTTSRWADDTPTHPNVSAANIAGEDWADINNNLLPQNATALSTQQQITHIYKTAIAQELFNTGAIKYVVIPIRDTENQDDFFRNYGNDRNAYIQAADQMPFLKKLNLHMDGLAVYENTATTPYITASTDLTATPQLKELEKLQSFYSAQLSGPFHFTPTQAASTAPATNLRDVFGTLAPTNFKAGYIQANAIPTYPNGTTLYVDTNRPSLDYHTTATHLTLYESDPDTLSVNNKPVGAPITPHTVLSQSMKPHDHYYLNENGNNVLIPIQPSHQQSIGLASNTTALFSGQGTNLVPNPSLENGLWQKTIGDCNNYDNNPMLFMGIDKTTASDSAQSLYLQAGSHIACTGPNPIQITGGSYYRFAFDYKLTVAKYAGYILTFNDPAHTVIRDTVPPQTQWSTFTRLLRAPPGATTVRIQLLGYPDELLRQFAVTNYDNLQLNPLSLVTSAPTNTPPTYTKVTLTPQSTIRYKTPDYTYANLVPNPSLENGLWQKTVGDCNNYDNNPMLGMKLDTNAPTKGMNALELDATRHIACSGPNPIALQPHDGKLYLSFSFESPNGSDAAYSITFNDPAHTTTTQQLPIVDAAWHTFSTTLTVPSSSTQFTLRFYSYATTPTNTTIVTRYAHFYVTQMPPVQGAYFALSKQPPMTAPQHISYKIVNPTTRLITVSDATTPFYINMSEAYNSKWRLELDNSKIHGLHSWFPFTHPDSIPSNDHYKLDDFANGWYVDTNSICTKQQLCTRNSNGSYNFTLEAEFVPQRWFTAGLLVSGSTCIMCIAYIWHTRKRRKVVDRGHYVARR